MGFVKMTKITFHWRVPEWGGGGGVGGRGGGGGGICLVGMLS